MIVPHERDRELAYAAVARLQREAAAEYRFARASYDVLGTPAVTAESVGMYQRRAAEVSAEARALLEVLDGLPRSDDGRGYILSMSDREHVSAIKLHRKGASVNWCDKPRDAMSFDRPFADVIELVLFNLMPQRPHDVRPRE